MGMTFSWLQTLRKLVVTYSVGYKHIASPAHTEGEEIIQSYGYYTSKHGLCMFLCMFVAYKTTSMEL